MLAYAWARRWVNINGFRSDSLPHQSDVLNYVTGKWHKNGALGLGIFMVHRGKAKSERSRCTPGQIWGKYGRPGGGTLILGLCDCGPRASRRPPACHRSCGPGRSFRPLRSCGPGGSSPAAFVWTGRVISPASLPHPPSPRRPAHPSHPSSCVAAF
jgi:hypothetical protein